MVRLTSLIASSEGSCASVEDEGLTFAFCFPAPSLATVSPRCSSEQIARQPRCGQKPCVGLASAFSKETEDTGSPSLLSPPLAGGTRCPITLADWDLKRKHFHLQQIAPGRNQVRPTPKQIPTSQGKQDFPGNPRELRAPQVTPKGHGCLSKHGGMSPQKRQPLRCYCRTSLSMSRWLDFFLISSYENVS